ncbi:MAG: MFS transporter [Rhodospirillales bacterium]
MTTTTEIRKAPPIAVLSIIVSMGLLGVGNGHLFAYVPVRLAAEGQPPWVAGAVVTALAIGAFVGCMIAGFVVRRVGHARAFAACSAGVILSVLMIAPAVDPYLWIASRFLYGVATSGLFIVSQSWLNDASPNNWRGKVIGAFYMLYVVAIGFGGYLIRFIELDGAQAPLLAIFFVALGILPVCLTRLPSPPPPASISIAVRSVWRISPVGLVGMLSVGGLTMLVQGFTPIYVSQAGYAKDDVGLLVLLMQFGMIAIQYPLGALSDRVDRRLVLIGASMLIVVFAWYAGTLDLGSFAVVAVVFAIWAGATETIYSVANAHANDRADPEYFVSLSSTMLIAWSLSGIVFPGLATALTPYLGPTAFIDVAIVLSVAYGGFVIFRITRRSSVPDADTGVHQPISAQAPYSAELSPQLGDDTRYDRD